MLTDWAVFLMVLLAMVTSTLARCECYYECCGKSCGKVLVFLMFFLTVCSAQNNNKKLDEENCRRGTIIPRDPYFFEGEDIVLNCSRRKGSWKKMTFLYGTQSTEVPKKYITKLNSTAIQLRIPNVTKEDINETEVSTMYRCVNKKNNSKCYDSVFVRLEYYIREPVDLQCRDHNFDGMICTWSLDVTSYHRPDDVTVTCSYKNATDAVSSLKYSSYKIHGEEVWESCVNQSNTACHWDDQFYPAPAPDFDVKVTVTNKKRNVTKVIAKTFNKYDIVEPDPVRGLTHSASHRCLQLKWRKPIKHQLFVYNITYKSNCSDEKSNTTFNASVKICDLIPNTSYNISVTCRLVEWDSNRKQFVERGHWSNPAVHEAVTNTDVLDVNPSTLPGLYDVPSTLKSPDGYTTVQLYWLPLPDCDLHDAADSVTYTVTAYNKTTSVKHPAFMAQIDVPQDKIINITVQVSNSKGHPDSKTVVTAFPEKFALYSSELVIQYNRTNEDCVTMAEVVVRENSSRFLNITHTLVWCKGTLHVCQEKLKRKKLGFNVTSFVLPGNLCDDDYRYGLVTYGYSKGQGQIVNSGIQWTECIYQLGKILDQPLKNIRKVSMDGGFSVGWNHYDCKVTRAYISTYKFSYCPGKGEEKCRCSSAEAIKHFNVSKQYNNFTPRDLQPDTHYCVWVRGISKAGPGPAIAKEMDYVKTVQNDVKYLWIMVPVFLVCLVAVGFAIRCFWRKYKHTCKEAKITIPPPFSEGGGNQVPLEYQSDSTTRLINSKTSGIGTISEYSNLSKTETTHMQNSSAEQPFLQGLFDDEEGSSDSDVLDGYKKPGTLFTEESGFADDNVPSCVESGEDFNKSGTHDHDSQEVLEKQISEVDNLSQFSLDKKEQNVVTIELKLMTSQSDNQCSLRNISQTQGPKSDSLKESLNSSSTVRNCPEEEIPFQPLSSDFHEQTSESHNSKENFFEDCIHTFSDSLDGYKGLESGSTCLDSGDEQYKVGNDDKDVEDKTFGVSGSPNGNVCEQSKDKLGSVSLASVPASYAIKHHSEMPIEHASQCDYPSLDTEASESEDARDENISTQFWSNNQDINVNGYKNSNDISSHSGSSGSNDSISEEPENQNGSGEQRKSLEIDIESNQISSGGKNGFIKKINEICSSGNSSSGESSQSNGGTSTDIPIYIIKEDRDTFKGKIQETVSKSLFENGKKSEDVTINS